MTAISIVIPVLNEADSIAQLHAEVKQVCQAHAFEYEIIVVDDGSTDNSLAVLRGLSPIRIVQFRKNYGQTAAFDAGIRAARYPLIATLDGDGQNDPADIPHLVRQLQEQEVDVVSGWRRKRHDSWSKRFVSRGANFLRGLLIHDGIHDSGCSLKVYRSECFDNLRLYGEMHRFIPALLKIRGFRIAERVVNHRPRRAGRTKYRWNRMVKGFIDMVSVWFWNKYAVRPLHLLGGMGLLMFLLGSLAALLAGYQWLFQNQQMSDSALPILTAFFLLSGIQLFVFGLVADTLLKSYFETTRNQPYSVKQIIEQA